MKKVGILTFSEADNYGAMLQAYALQKYVSAMGFNCNQIRYRNMTIWKAYHYVPLRERPSLISYIKKNVELFVFRKKRRKFEEFRATCKMTQVVSSDGLQDEAKKYDKIIVGSDQVWNPRNTNGDMHFLLDFVNDDNKKVAYAASLGNTEFFSEFGKNAPVYLSQIPSISVREEKAAQFIRTCFNLYCISVCDPVLLLDREEWKNCVSSTSHKDEYVFVYLLKPNKELVKGVNSLLDSEGLKAYVVPGVVNVVYQAKNIKRSKIILDAGPIELISLLEGAKYVVTDSFHGTALSIVLQKQFAVFVDEGTDNTNSRIDNILAVCNLNNRQISDSKKIDVVKCEIDFDKVRGKLDEYKKISKEFLRSALS